MKHRASVVCILACVLCCMLGLMGCSSQTEEYSLDLGSATVSSPTIGEDGVLCVGIMGEDSAPFTMTSNGEVTGLDVDIAAALADQMGLSLEIVDVESESDGETALTNGEIDILMSVPSDSSSSIWLSDPYIETAIALFGDADAEIPTRDSSPVIAAQGSSTSAWAVTTAFGDDSLLSSSDLMSAFSSAEEGEASYVAADAVIGTYAAFYQSVDMVPIALLEDIGGYCIGVASDNTDLQEAVTSALTEVIDGGIADVISNKWLGTTLDLSSLSVIDSSSSSSDATTDTTSDDDTTDDESSAGSNAVVLDETEAAA